MALGFRGSFLNSSAGCTCQFEGGGSLSGVLTVYHQVAEGVDSVHHDESCLPVSLCVPQLLRYMSRLCRVEGVVRGVPATKNGAIGLAVEICVSIEIPRPGR